MIDVTNATILDLQMAMEQKRITARELVFYWLERIAQFDRCPGGLSRWNSNQNAFHESSLNPAGGRCMIKLFNHCVGQGNGKTIGG